MLQITILKLYYIKNDQSNVQKFCSFNFHSLFVFFSIRSSKKVYLRIDNKKSRKIDSANTHVEILISNREREEVFFRQNWNTYQVVVEWTRKAHSSSDLKSTYVDKFSFFYPLAQTHISLKYKTFFSVFKDFFLCVPYSKCECCAKKIRKMALHTFFFLSSELTQNFLVSFSCSRAARLLLKETEDFFNFWCTQCH